MKLQIDNLNQTLKEEATLRQSATMESFLFATMPHSTVRGSIIKNIVSEKKVNNLN